MNEVAPIFWASYVALWVLVVLQGAILMGVVHMVHEISQAGAGALKREGTGAAWQGMQAPEFEAVDVAGRLVRSADYNGQTRALLFVSPTCPGCLVTLSEMRALRQKARGDVIFICRAQPDECAKLAEKYALDAPIIPDVGERISRLFGISAVPMAVIIDGIQRIQRYGHPVSVGMTEVLGDGVAVNDIGAHGNGQHRVKPEA